MDIAFAVVGCGRIGRRHASIIQALPGMTLKALVDTDEGAAKGAATAGASDAGIPFFSSLDALLSSPLAEHLDVVSITTPNGLHAAQACTALEAGLHVVIEKPMALTAADARKVLETAERTGKRVFTVMQNRYSDSARWLKEVLVSGVRGRIFMVQLDCYWNRDSRYYGKGGWHGTKELDGGALYTQFSHWIDMLYWLFGDITRIERRMENFNHQETTDFEDSGLVTFDFVRGGMGALHFSTAVWDRNLESNMTIVAEFGSIKIGGQYMERVEYCHGRDLEAPPMGLPADADAHHRDLFTNALQVLRGRAGIDIDPADGCKVVEIIERIYKG